MWNVGPPDGRAFVRLRRRLASLDPALLGAAFALVALGTLAVASATLDGPGTEGLWRTQLMWLLVATAAAVVVVTVDYRVWAGIALLLHGVGMETELFSPTFAVGRVGGWTAHILEQIAEARMIRPRAAYGGELNRVWMPIEERGNGATGR